jgi:signal recognition particle subunit SEC65
MQVFISHSAVDEPLVQRLKKALSDRGLEVWTAEQIQPGQSWTAHVKSVIEKADAVIPVLSAASEKSQWMAAELSLAIAEQLSGRRLIIIPVLADRKAEAPFFIRDLKWVDLSSEDRFRANIEVLARALQSDTEGTPSQPQILASRRELIEAQERLLKDERKSLEEHQIYLTRLVYWFLAAAVLNFAGMMLVQTVWVQLGGRLSLSIGTAFTAFFIGVLVTVVTWILFRRHHHYHGKPFWNPWKREKPQHSITGGGNE